MAFSLLLIVVLGAAALFFATHLPLPEDRSQRVFAPDLVQRGGELAALGYCASCHTAEKGRPFAGARPLATPFGTILGTNITPDQETGIGLSSQAAFNRAMRDGIDRAGRDLYPAFPYDHFTKLEDEDLSALYAFLMTREAVHAPNPANQLAFPYNLRPLLAGWKLLYLNKDRVPRDASKSAEWNRGAYLVEAISHCSACHTPRDRLGAEIAAQRFDGGEAEGWWAPPLNRNSPSPAGWSEETLFNYLRSWDAEHGGAAGPMVPVVAALATVPEQDVRAIAAYVASTLAKPGGSEARVKDKQAQAVEAHRQGAELYSGICATCHETSGHVPFTVASLGQHTSIHAPDPRNVIHVVLEGIQPPEGTVGAIMPAFSDTLSDAQIAEILTYLRSRFSGGAQWQNIEAEIARIRRKDKPMITLNVNGRSHDVDDVPNTPLLYVLRDTLELNGAKFGCGLGQCGACTVVVEGKPVFSCLTPISILQGRKITTLEGLGTEEAPSPLQRAFIEEQAAQCGYCIPGMIMRAHALLTANRVPTDAQIREHMNPNLCRCGTHMRILAAIRRAARGMQAADASVPAQEVRP